MIYYKPTCQTDDTRHVMMTSQNWKLCVHVINKLLGYVEKLTGCVEKLTVALPAAGLIDPDDERRHLTDRRECLNFFVELLCSSCRPDNSSSQLHAGLVEFLITDRKILYKTSLIL